MKYTMSGIMSEQLGKRARQPVIQADLTGKTVVVVGANMGLGFEACKHFARMGPARLVMACRDPKRGEEALQLLEKDTGFKRAEVSILDLGSFASCKEFCARWQGRLDILVMNAGVAYGDYVPLEGWETTIKINHLGTAMVTLLLLPHLKATAQKYAVVPRVVVVSSHVHYLVSIPESIVNDEDEPVLRTLGSKEYCTAKVMQERYPLSKLLNVFFVRALTEHLKKEIHPIIVNALNPGYCISGLRRRATMLQNAMFWVLDQLFVLTTEEGSRGLVWAALGSKGDEDKLRGGYVSFFDTQEVSDYVLSETGAKCQERVWNETIDILAAEEPKIRAISAGKF